MGCKHYFVADRLEALVDEGDSRSSSRAHERENFRLVSQRYVAIQTPKKSMSTSSSCVDEAVGCPLTTGLPVLSRSAPTSLSVCLSKRSTNKLVFLQSRERETCIDFLTTRTGRLFCHNGSLRSIIGSGFGWVGWLLSVCRATSEPNSFIHSFLKEIFGGGRGDSYTFSFNDFSSSFHPNSFRDTIGCESRLIEL